MSTKNCPKCKEIIQSGATKCKHCGADLRSWFRRHYIITTLLILYFLGMFMKSTLDYTTNNISNTQLNTSGKVAIQQTSKPTTLKAQLEQIVKSQGNYTITYIGNETDENIYLDIEKAPGKNSIVISGPASSCTDAKRNVYEILKGIYTNPKLANKLGRIKVISLNKLKASMGYTDGSKLDWENFGPTLMMDVYDDIGSNEIEYGELNNRTYGFFFGDC